MRKIIVTTLAVTILGVGGVPVLGSISDGPMLLGTAAAQSTSNVTIQNSAYSPTSVTVEKGTTVTWTNRDSTPHTVTADSGSGPNSGQLKNGQSYSYTFAQAGTFAYHCTLHPQMKATAIVKEAAAPAPAPAPQTPAPSAGGANQPQQPSAPAPTGGRGAGPPVAAGPVETGGGSTTGLEHVTALVAGILSLSSAGVLAVKARHEQAAELAKK
ncbi:MAG: plastocyanin [Candidatus Saccharibacteria bacterium]|nr:plastocyanin [Candidatus Saccharibacteria bacterium]